MSCISYEKKMFIDILKRSDKRSRFSTYKILMHLNIVFNKSNLNKANSNTSIIGLMI